MKPILALDTNVLLYVLTNHPEFGATSKQILQGKHGGNLQVSDLVIVELLSHKSVKTDTEYQKVNKFIDSQLFAHVPIKEPVLHKAAELRREHAISLADAIHIASAVVNHATYFVTNDQELVKKKLKDIEVISIADIKEAALFPRDINRLTP